MELKNVSKNVALDNRTIKILMKVKYGSRIIITEKPGKLTFICFVHNYYILTGLSLALQIARINFTTKLIFCPNGSVAFCGFTSIPAVALPPTTVSPPQFQKSHRDLGSTTRSTLRSVNFS